MNKVLRKNKIEYLAAWYRIELNNPDNDLTAEILNQIIIDSVGVSGLKEVKNRAWKAN